jgi:hypothetical protein
VRLDHLLSKEHTIGSSACRRRDQVHSRVDHSLLGHPSEPSFAGSRASRRRCAGASVLLCSVLRERPCASPFAVRRFAFSSYETAAARALLDAGPTRPLRTEEQARASRSEEVIQATKSQRWMPWRLMPMKDVGDCEKPREAVDQALIRGCPNGETRHPSWGVTPV